MTDDLNAGGAAAAGADEGAQREEALARREAELVRRELRQGAGEALAARGLPSALLNAIDLTSEEARDRSLDSVEAAFRQSVRSGVDERLRASIAPGRTARAADYGAMSDAEYYAATYKSKE